MKRYLPGAATAAGVLVLLTGIVRGQPWLTVGATGTIVGVVLIAVVRVNQHLRYAAERAALDGYDRGFDEGYRRAQEHTTRPRPRGRYREPRPRGHLRVVKTVAIGVPSGVGAWVAGRIRDHAAGTVAVASVLAAAPIAGSVVNESVPPGTQTEVPHIHAPETSTPLPESGEEGRTAAPAAHAVSSPTPRPSPTLTDPVEFTPMPTNEPAEPSPDPTPDATLPTPIPGATLTPPASTHPPCADDRDRLPGRDTPTHAAQPITGRNLPECRPGGADSE